MRISRQFHLQNPDGFKKWLLDWGNQFEAVVFLDSNHHNTEYGSFDAVLAVGVHSQVPMKKGSGFKALKAYKNEVKDWLFGYLGYDLKNELESLQSENPDGLGFEELFFFQPQRIITINKNEVNFHYLSNYESSIEADYKGILAFEGQERLPSNSHDHPKIKLGVHKEEYLNKVTKVLDDIHRGKIYEVNICQEFYVKEGNIDPLSTYMNLNEISTPPFAAFLKWNNKYALCASPERYLKRIGEKVISQPIKGTAARSLDAVEDDRLRTALAKDAKEQAENVMIVDLVRNDLSKRSKKGSVAVEELFGIYTFKQVHQMISTVTANFNKFVDSVDIIKDSFPMGSMTGAPKIAAMELIEEIEVAKRGLYSGAIGYFTPTDDFDFNVVIRSILYNANSNYVSFTVGSAITANSIPIKEYEECLLKAKAMRSVLESQQD